MSKLVGVAVTQLPGELPRLLQIHWLESGFICVSTTPVSFPTLAIETGKHESIYPRTDGWLFGGTRLESEDLPPETTRFCDELAPWIGEQWVGDTITVPQEGMPNQTCEVPAPIITLNRELIHGASLSASR